MAVIDPYLRVHGLEALRVVDVSVMPPLIADHHDRRKGGGMIKVAG